MPRSVTLVAAVLVVVLAAMTGVIVLSVMSDAGRGMNPSVSARAHVEDGRHVVLTVERVSSPVETQYLSVIVVGTNVRP